VLGAFPLGLFWVSLIEIIKEGDPEGLGEAAARTDT